MRVSLLLSHIYAHDVSISSFICSFACCCSVSRIWAKRKKDAKRSKSFPNKLLKWIVSHLPHINRTICKQHFHHASHILYLLARCRDMSLAIFGDWNRYRTLLLPSNGQMAFNRAYLREARIRFRFSALKAFFFVQLYKLHTECMYDY